MELSGRIAVVTGASAGIGAAAARALAREGMTVVAVARRADRLAELAASSDRIVAYPADVTDAGAPGDLARWVSAELGACHVLVNNAGRPGSYRFHGEEQMADLEALIQLNFVAAARCTAAFAELLGDSAPARVINVASVAGKVGISAPAYTASKFALVGFSEALRLQWAARGVAVCQLNPGFIATEGFPQTDLLASRVTRGLVGKPQAAAEAIVRVARSGQAERTVPRWYRAAVLLRHLAPGVWWPLAARLAPRR